MQQLRRSILTKHMIGVLWKTLASNVIPSKMDSMDNEIYHNCHVFGICANTVEIATAVLAA